MYKSCKNYRFGFNRQEKVDEITGQFGSHNTAEFWEYDTRIGRRWNLDPKPQISISDYAAFGNSPIWFSYPLGDVWKIQFRGGFLGLGKIRTVIYNGGGITNEDGSIYNGRITPFLSKSINALDYTRKTNTGKEAVSAMTWSKNVFLIKKKLSYTEKHADGRIEYHTGNEFHHDNRYKAYRTFYETAPESETHYEELKRNGTVFSGGSGGTIFWNPNGGCFLKEFGGKEANRPYVFFAHEVFHGYDAERGLMDFRKVSDSDVERSELQASFLENLHRMSLKLPLREYYGTIRILNASNMPYIP